MTSKSRKSSANSTASPAKRDTPTRKAVRAKGTPRPKDPEHATTCATATKQDHCLQLLARPDGATLSELVAATGWQPHSVRGFLSGAVKKKLGLPLVSSRDDDGTRRYRTDRVGRGR